MLNQHQIQLLPERICKHLSDINTEYLVSVGEVLKEIGELRPTDVHQLQQMYNYGARADEIAKRLAVVSQKDIAEIYDIFDIVAKENYKFAKPFYEARFMDYIPYEENIPLQRKVKAMAKQTVDEYKNMTQHTAFAIFSKDGKSLAPLYEKNANKIATNLSDTYTKIVDYAVTQVNMGMESYTKAVNDIIKAMSASGIRTVDYATDYSRRLDSAVRQNVLFGVKECNQQVANLVGEEFGADGMEVDYHMHPRPSHADMGGRQYALGQARTVKGVFYPSFEEKAKPLLEEYGCLHFAFPIILGVSRPAYTEKELQEYAKADKVTFEFEGEKYTMYEGTQLQRKVETALRHQRDILNMAKAAGDSETELIARGKIRMLTDKYVKLSEASGLPTQMERTKMAVSAKSVDKSRGSGIIKSGAVSGARNPYGSKAREHANRYYGLVRSMNTDVEKIATTTGHTIDEIQKIKNYVFYDKHDLGGIEAELFEPDYMMGESWRRLMAGIPEQHDLILIEHELMEIGLMEKGYSQEKAHILTSKKYNYDKEATEFYDKIEKYSD
jgi:hypothetical protein